METPHCSETETFAPNELAPRVMVAEVADAGRITICTGSYSLRAA